jgi:hypothetical protein
VVRVFPDLTPAELSAALQVERRPRRSGRPCGRIEEEGCPRSCGSAGVPENRGEGMKEVLLFVVVLVVFIAAMHFVAMAFHLSLNQVGWLNAAVGLLVAVVFIWWSGRE